jgi:hypothetical protein
MPPAAPVKGFPRVGIVFARLIVSGEDRGIRPFITWLSDGEHMCDGVTAKYVWQFNTHIDKADLHIHFRLGCSPDEQHQSR